jgi:hypothetical protein
VQFSYAGTSESTQTSFGSGGYNSTHTISLTYRLRSRGAGAFTIPAFEVKSDKGPMRVSAFTGGARATSGLDNAATSRLMPANTSVWAGEVFPLTYTLDVIRRNFSQLSPTIEWNPSPLISEEWSKPEANEVLVNGEARFSIVYKSRGLAKNPGPLTLNGASQLVNLQTGSIGFGIFQTPRVEQLNVESNRPKITVRPLPPAPPGFSGAVGEFKLVSKVVPERAAVGEPVTWTIELSGTGNWPDIAGLPSREVSNDFQVVQPKAKRTPPRASCLTSRWRRTSCSSPPRPAVIRSAPSTSCISTRRAGATKRSRRHARPSPSAPPARRSCSIPSLPPPKLRRRRQ